METRVLVLRTGLNGGGTRTEEEVAGSLGVRIVRVQQLARRGLQNLRAAAAFGLCEAQGSQSVGFGSSTGSSPLLSSTSPVLPWKPFAAQPVDLLASNDRLFGVPARATQLNDPPPDVLLLLGLAAVILGVGLLLQQWRDRRRRALKERIAGLGRLMREKPSEKAPSTRPGLSPDR
ncbi:MAG: hypothetical protein AABM29_00110 [Actinomycetota bacterium]